MTDFACAILFDGRRILLGKRAPHRRAYPNCWDVIGGRVEAGETIDAALIRELAEEIGVVPTAFVPLLTIIDHNNPQARDGGVYHFYRVTAWTGTPGMLNDEHSELRWFPIAEAAGLTDLPMEEYRALFRLLMPAAS